MRRPILRYGDPVLHARAAPVQALTPAIDTLIDDMHETLRDASGVGLAAPQIGESLRLCLVDLSAGRRPDQLLVLINPEILESDGLQLKEEGCLSLPGIEATVPRPLRMRVRAMDRDGDTREIQAEGLLARALQHEIDHLDGVLFVDHLSKLKRDMILRKTQKLKKSKASA
jgi:peptide deformylase